MSGMEYRPLGESGLMISAVCLGTWVIGGEGRLTGKFNASTTFSEDDNRSGNPMFRGEAFKEHLAAVEKLKPIAAKYGKTLAQLAIAWNLHQPGVTTALTGARRPEQVEENAGGAGWQISQSDLDEIEGIFAGLTELE